ncbi:hypothetical protein BCR35DRAFT_303383 [Leucosporidium creatinivorum]|uniref:RmlC-like cupin domain-containing protein n=1 Tax=Leucosporidium creatinivorum TaxID=106004 RepID=A0A1Y2FL70_9BASI|nr:hypothetical protein BCR35DRAFT_303383 [Leucosporidium creatinivorum]
MRSSILLALALLPAALALPHKEEAKSNGKGKNKDKHHGHFEVQTKPFSNTTLYIPAIAVGENQFAQPECWGIQPNYTVGTDPSLAGTLDVSLGNVSTASYVYFPDDFSAPLHGPGSNQFVIWLTGAATIYFPNATGTIDCVAGTNLAVVDNSTVSTGHYTNWTAGTSVLLVTFNNHVIPPHTVVDRSYC